MLLAIFVASSASPIPTDVGEDYSDIGFLSYPDESLVIYRVAEDDSRGAEASREEVTPGSLPFSPRKEAPEEEAQEGVPEAQAAEEESLH